MTIETLQKTFTSQEIISKIILDVGHQFVQYLASKRHELSSQEKNSISNAAADWAIKVRDLDLKILKDKAVIQELIVNQFKESFSKVSEIQREDFKKILMDYLKLNFHF